MCLRGMFDLGTKPVCERDARAAFARAVVEPTRCATVTLEDGSLTEARP